jgi:hypothetical protein
MKFEAGKTYKTRGGEEAFIYCVDAPGSLPVHGRIGSAIYCWTVGGNILPICSHKDDLIAPEPERISQTVWVSIYKNDPPSVDSTKENAERYATKNALRVAVPCLLTEITA